MKIRGYVFLLCAFAGCASNTDDNTWEKEIRAAEQAHVTAFASNDVVAIETLLLDDFLVNSPRYEGLDKRQLMELARRGILNVQSFSQDIERIRRYGDIAVLCEMPVRWHKLPKMLSINYHIYSFSIIKTKENLS